MIHYKYKSAKDFSSMPAEGPAVSVLQLKQYIVGKMCLKRPADFDLVVSNPHTNEDYDDDGLIPKNSSVIVRRVPAKMYNRPAAFVPAPTPAPVSQPKPRVVKMEDEFGEKLYEEPQAPVSAPADEEAMIKAFCAASASDWERQTQQTIMDRGRGFGRGGRGPGGLVGGRGPFFAKKTPPEGYVCHRCNEPGHFIQHCPTNSDPAYNIKRVKLPTGIPRTMLVSNPSGSYALPNGEIATLRPNEELFEREVNGLSATRTITEVPAELRCPLCKEVLKDAVLTSKCCFKSYCDKCIRDEICSKGKCVCGIHALADDLLPNRTLRDAIERLLASAAATSSGGNTPSQQNAPDMESAVPVAKSASPPAVKGPVLPDKQAASEAEGPAQHDTAEVSSAPTKEATVSDQAEQPTAVDDEDNEREQLQQTTCKPKRRNPRQIPEGMPWMPPPFWHYPMDAYMHMGDGVPRMPIGYGEPYSYPFVPQMMPGVTGAAFPPRDAGYMKEAARSPSKRRSHEYEEKRSEDDSSERRVRQRSSDTTECKNGYRDSRGRQSERDSESRDKYYKDGKHSSRHNSKDPKTSDHEGSRHRDYEDSDSRKCDERKHKQQRREYDESRYSRHEYNNGRHSRSSSGHRREDREDDRKRMSGFLTEESNGNIHNINHVSCK